MEAEGRAWGARGDPGQRTALQDLSCETDRRGHAKALPLSSSLGQP